MLTFSKNQINEPVSFSLKKNFIEDAHKFIKSF